MSQEHKGQMVDLPEIGRIFRRLEGERVFRETFGTPLTPEEELMRHIRGTKYARAESVIDPDTVTTLESKITDTRNWVLSTGEEFVRGDEYESDHLGENLSNQGAFKRSLQTSGSHGEILADREKLASDPDSPRLSVTYFDAEHQRYIEIQFGDGSYKLAIDFLSPQTTTILNRYSSGPKSRQLDTMTTEEAVIINFYMDKAREICSAEKV